MNQFDANKMYERESQRIEEHNKSILIDLPSLSKIAGFEVIDYELSIDLTECLYYGSKGSGKDGFISISDVKELK